MRPKKVAMLVALCGTGLLAVHSVTAQERRDGGVGEVPRDFTNREFGSWNLTISGESMGGCTVDLSNRTNGVYYTMRQRMANRACSNAFPRSAVYWELYRGEVMTFLDASCETLVQFRKVDNNTWEGPNGVGLVREARR